MSILKQDGDPTFEFPKPIPLTESLFDRLDPRETIAEKYWLSEEAVKYFERVDADKSHNHNFTIKGGGRHRLHDQNQARNKG